MGRNVLNICAGASDRTERSVEIHQDDRAVTIADMPPRPVVLGDSIYPTIRRFGKHPGTSRR